MAHTITVPRGIPDQTWAVLLRDTWSRAFFSIGHPCVTIWIQYLKGTPTVVLYDPHQHLDEEEVRGALRARIREIADPALADYICLILLAGH